MPASCAKAFAPTMALFGWTGMPVYALTRRLVRAICVVSMLVSRPKTCRPGVQRHHDLFERGVAGPLADAVDRHLDLPRAVLDRGQRVRRRQPQVVVAVRRDDDVVRARHVLAGCRDQPAELRRRGVADGVRDVQRRRAGLDRDREHLVAGTRGRSGRRPRARTRRRRTGCARRPPSRRPASGTPRG